MAKVDKKALAALRRTAKGAHGRLKDREPSRMGGRLPGGLNQCVGKITSCDVSMSKKNSIQFSFQFVVVEDSIDSGSTELVGTKAMQFYGIFDSERASKEDRLAWFYEDLMRLGYKDEIQKCDTEEDVITDIFIAMEGDLFVFNTGTKENNGFYPLYIEGPVPPDYIPPTKDGGKKKEVEEPEEDHPADDIKESPFAIGDLVQVDYDGELFSGTVKELTDTEAVILFDDDGSEESILFADVISQEAEAEPEEKNDFSVGDIVFCGKLRGEDKRVEILELDPKKSVAVLQRVSSGRKLSKPYGLDDLSFDE